jgi:hypothetical protein
MSQIALAKELADDRDGIRTNDWATFESRAIGTISGMYPDIATAQIETYFPMAIAHLMVSLYYEANDVDEIHINSAKHHFDKYRFYIESFQPPAALLTQYDADALNFFTQKFPDLTNLPTRFSSVIHQYKLARFFEKNGDDVNSQKAQGLMALVSKAIQEFQPANADLTQYDADGVKQISYLFPDIKKEGISLRFSSALRNYCLFRFYAKNGDDGNAQKSTYHENLFKVELQNFQPSMDDCNIFIQDAKSDLISRRPYLTNDDMPNYSEALDYYKKAKFLERNGVEKHKNESVFFYRKYREIT